MLAILKTGGKQYKASVGDKLLIEKVEGKKGSSIDLKEVLLVSDQDKNIEVGTPFVEKAVVKAKIIDHTKTDKVIVFKKNKRQNYRRKKGHRQEMTQIEIVEIKK